VYDGPVSYYIICYLKFNYGRHIGICARAFLAWLEADLHKISKEDIEKVINNITSTHVCFNAKNCSEATGVPLYYVLVIFLAFLVDGQLYVESEISGNSA
jgi:hypothetical protein